MMSYIMFVPRSFVTVFRLAILVPDVAECFAVCIVTYMFCMLCPLQDLIITLCPSGGLARSTQLLRFVDVGANYGDIIGTCCICSRPDGYSPRLEILNHLN